MGFKDMLGKAQEFADPTGERVSAYLDQFNAALRDMQALGFSVTNLQVSMGILPEVSAKLIAATANIDSKALDEMIKKKAGQDTLVALLKGLQTAYNVRNQLGDLGLRGIEIDVTLGLPPKISINFLKTPSTAPPAVVTGSA